MQDDDFETDDLPPIEPKTIIKTPGVSHKLPDIEIGKEDCYWCGRVFDKTQMIAQKNHNTIVYICKDCGYQP